MEEETKQDQQEERKAEQDACEAFMNLAFTQIIKKVFETRVYPALSAIVDRLASPYSLKGKVSLPDIQRLNADIHSAVMKTLFSPVPGHKVSSPEQDSEEDSSEGQARELSWLVS